MPPRNPAPNVCASMPPTRPGAMPGRSAIEKAMKPERTATKRWNAVPPPIRLRAAAERAFLIARVNAADGKGERDRETARDHDRQHVGNAGHEMFVGAGARLERAAFACSTRFGERHGRAAGRLRESGRDDFLAAVHRLLRARGIERLAGESARYRLSCRPRSRPRRPPRCLRA